MVAWLADPLSRTVVSVATTNVWLPPGQHYSGRVLPSLVDGYGLAEGGSGNPASLAVVSGRDFRRNGEPYINQLIILCQRRPRRPTSGRFG